MILCQNPLPLPGPTDRQGKAMANTYCMRPMGHPGKCAETRQPEDEKEAAK